MTKPVIIAAGGLVKNEKGEILMIYRRGKWDLPKGKLDKGESIETCALREVMEETGLRDVRLGKLISTGYHEYADKHLKADVVKETHWYHMSVNGEQMLVPQTEEDITDIRWVSGKELEDCLNDSFPNIVDVVKKGGY